jgi:putative IMPACT (imprinted ancient) family translation regulator
MLTPRNLIDVGEAINGSLALNMFDSVSMNLQFKVFIKPEKPDEAIARKNCGQRWVTSLFKSTLVIRIGS